jgi:hypothetical protein
MEKTIRFQESKKEQRFLLIEITHLRKAGSIKWYLVMALLLIVHLEPFREGMLSG